MKSKISSSPHALFKKFYLRIIPWALICLSAICLFSSSVEAKNQVNPLFSDHMVLQRDQPAAVFGTGDEGDKVTVKINNQTKTGIVKNGQWRILLDPNPAGGPYELHISSKNSNFEFKDVLFGDVWVCSGQSNMAGSVRHYAHQKYKNVGGEVYANLIANAADYDQIRLIGFDKTPTEKVLSNPVIHPAYKGSWQRPNAQALGDASAIGCVFAIELNNELKVPIGVITAARGATPISTWMSDEAHKACGNKLPSKTYYRSMIAPLTKFTIKGAIWYQGENNSRSFKSCATYGPQFKALISGWREEWSQGDFPFLFFPLSGFQMKPKFNSTIHWPYMREAQASALELPNTGMTVITDLGHPTDIHPHYKADQAKRMAPLALKIAYKKDIVGSGPVFKDVVFSKGKAIVTFKNIGDGLIAEKIDTPWLKTEAGKLQGFTIAGQDKKFYQANAIINGDQVEVSSPNVKSPKALRYAWGGMPKANLFNKNGFAAPQFRTDSFTPGEETWATTPD